MPIRPENRHRYTKAAGWPEIRRQVLSWDRHCCAFCGVHNSEYVARTKALTVKYTRIILTIAHLDGSTDHSDPANLRALCQRCHLLHDAKQHAESAARTRALQRTVSGQQQIEGMV